MMLPAHQVLLLILFTSAVFMLCVCQGIKIPAILILQIVINRECIMALLHQSIVSLNVSPVDFPLFCSALLQCDHSAMCSPHTG